MIHRHSHTLCGPWKEYLRELPETGPGYHMVDLHLRKPAPYILRNVRVLDRSRFTAHAPIDLDSLERIVVHDPERQPGPSRR